MEDAVGRLTVCFSVFSFWSDYITEKRPAISSQGSEPTISVGPELILSKTSLASESGCTLTSVAFQLSNYSLKSAVGTVSSLF